MSSKTFEKMLQTSERLVDNGTYGDIGFRLSGGEPLLVYDTYKDLVSKYYKCNRNFSFGLLSNLTILTDEMLKGLQKNRIGVQVSLDDLENSKPLANGQSSSKITMRNIKRFQEEGIGFSINTVLDIKNTKSLKDMVEYICSLNNVQWGLNASYTMNDESISDEVIKVFKEAILLLGEKNFNILYGLRFYNMTIGRNEGGCISGIGTCALGTNLEVWPCQCFSYKKPLGYYDENIKEILATSKENEYFRNRTLLPQCTDCSILQYCRGGCRAVNMTDEKAVEVTCKIKQEVVKFILEKRRELNNNTNNCDCGGNNHQQNNCRDGGD
jgi:radical SAM protein with 4Fe4S-binding SPASM domain